MKVIADQDLCCGSGMCVMTADQVFDQREEDGIVVVVDEAPPPEQHEAVRVAAAGCPASAIRLVE
ncbi:ferredoxin [Nonomuraea sp. NPDC050022]|uniref:ferredoxin n=1 Tax=Nonomuraea sp. NPDC050022 TaxID=3364358 RepID=UPI0037889558